MVYKTA